MNEKASRSEPTVSVIIPTYNRASLLPTAIASICQQTLPDWELIVVDDGSTDDTRQVAAHFTDPRITYIFQPNRGVSAALNTGIQRCRGEYVAFLGSDDQFLPNRLAAEVKVFEMQAEIGLVASGWRYVDEKGKVVQEARPWIYCPDLDVVSWLLHCPVGSGTILVKRTWLERIGGFDETLRNGGDFDLGLRLAYAGCHMAWAAESLSLCRLHPENLSRDGAGKKHGLIATLDKFYANPDLPAELLAIKGQVYSKNYLSAAFREYGAGQIEPAKQDLVQAIQMDPSLLEGKRLLEMLVPWMRNPMVTDHPGRYLSTVLSNLPELAACFRLQKRQAQAELAALQLFEAHRERDRRGALRSALQLAWHSPARVLDRGVISVLLESLLGTRTTQRLRKALHRLTRRTDPSNAPG